MDEDASKQIQALRNQLGELQLMLLSTLAEVRALTLLSTALWEKQSIEMAEGRTISEVLRLLKRDVVDNDLAKLADMDMNAASKLRMRMEAFLRKKDPPNL